MRNAGLAGVVLALGGVVAGCSGGSSGKAVVAQPASTASPVISSSTPIGPFRPAFNPVGVNVPAGPLFDLPPGYLANGGDPVFPPSLIESDSFTDRNPAVVPSTLKLVVWNVEKGLDTQQVVHELQTIPALMDADFIFLQECPRHDVNSVPANVSFAREVAQTLRMDYVFAVEWDYRHARQGGGENGSAILSKYPIGNVDQLRAQPYLNYWVVFKRLGGPLTLAADVQVDGRLLRLYNVHLMVFDFGQERAVQAADVLADADLPTRSPLQILSGDMNTWTYNPLLAGFPTHGSGDEQAIVDILNAGWTDGLPGPPYTQLGAGFLPQLLDWVFYRNLPSTGASSVEFSASGADHLPLVFEFSVR